MMERARESVSVRWPQRDGVRTLEPLHLRRSALAVRHFGSGFSAQRSHLDRARFDLTLRGRAWMRVGREHVLLHRGVPMFRPAGAPVASGVIGDELVQFSILLTDDVGPQEARFHPASPALVFRALREYQAPDSTSALTLEALTAELVLLLNGERQAEEADSPWLSDVVDRLRDEPDEAPTLDDLAQQANVHFTTVARVFRSALRCTPGEYLRSLRLTRASVRLANGDGTIARIAVENGFADQSHFGRWFRTMFGETPGAYRRRFRD